MTIQPIESAVKIFEEIEKIRKSCQIRLTHLEKNRICLSCERDWMPRRSEPCPECGSKNTRVMKVKLKCLDCDHKWEHSGKLCCPWCGSEDSKSAPKTDEYITNVALPRLQAEEAFYEKQMQDMVHAHPVWDWAVLVKGAGETTMARIIGKTDIKRCNTVSEFWAHCGFGLDSEGKPQRKKAGQLINYDQHLQSNCVILGESLLRAADTYYKHYLVFKASRDGLTPAHAHNHGFRLMIKLFLSHLWEVWRIAEELEAPEPYAFAMLKHASGHRIRPSEMIKQERVCEP